MGRLVRTYKRMDDGGPIMQQDHTRTAQIPLRIPTVSGYDQWRNALPKNLQEDSDYDLQGYYNKYGNKGPASNGHLPDEFKKPNHVTFSNESIYNSDKTPGGQWSQQNGKWSFKPSPYNIQNVGVDSLKDYFKQNEPDSKLIMKANGGTIKKPTFSSLKKMDGGGDSYLKAMSAGQDIPLGQATTGMPSGYNIPDVSGYGPKAQSTGLSSTGFSSAAGFGAATIDAFAPTDSYGVRSNGAAIGSGALKGAASGAAAGSVLGPEGTLIGAGVGAIVGGVTGLTGNEKAIRAKNVLIQKSTTSQLSNDQQLAESRIAGDPSLKYGKMSASYYRFGGVMKNSPATLPRTTKPLPAVQANQRLMPNITEAPNRQMSRMANGGNFGMPTGTGQLPNALKYNATKLFRPDKPLRAQKNQILANGGTLRKAGHTKPHFIPKGQPQLPQVNSSAPQQQAGPLQQPQMDPNQLAQMQQMMQQQGMPQKANGGQVEPLSSQDAMINGPSHENGGVKFPSMGVELEGGETVNNGFVFSKKLGFAKPAEAIAKQLGRAEKRPETAINTATIQALQRKTELLKVHQEAAKKAAGIPSDLPEMANGGTIGGPDNPPILPIITSNPNDPRIKAYNDSLKLYNRGQQERQYFNKPYKEKELTKLDLGISPKARYSKTNNDIVGGNKAIGYDNVLTRYIDTAPTGTERLDSKVAAGASIPIFKKPNQPVVYQPQKQDNQIIQNGKPLSPTNPLMAEKKDGSIGQWGNPLVPASAVPTLPVIPLTGSNGYNPTTYQDNGTPGVNIRNTPTPATIKPSSRYKFGGNLKKMDDGGTHQTPATYPWSTNPITTLNNKLRVPGVLDTVNITDTKPVTPTPVTLPAVPGAVDTPVTPANNTAGNISGVFEKAAPFLSNFVNATQKLPLPPVPVLNTELTPNLVDYSASRNEAVRANRSANASARTNLNSGAAVSAATAANLAGQTRAVSQINEAENNQNAQVRNSTAAENAQIRAGNTALQNNYQNELVARQVKAQSMASANMANVEEKIHGMGIDQKLQDNEHTKLMLTALSDPTGATWRGARGQFAKYLPANQMAELDAYNKKLSDRYDADNELDRKQKQANLAASKSYTDWAKANPDKLASENPYYGIGPNAPSTIFKGQSTKVGPNGTTVTTRD